MLLPKRSQPNALLVYAIHSFNCLALDLSRHFFRFSGQFSLRRMENDVHAQLYRWFQARAGAPAGQRARAAVGSLSVAQQDRLHAELQGILVAAAGGTTQPDAGAVAVMSRAVLQYIEVLVTLALDHAAAAGGMDASEKHVVAVLAPHNEYQAVRSAALVRKYHCIRAMTSHEAVRVPVEGYHEGGGGREGLQVASSSTSLARTLAPLLGRGQASVLRASSRSAPCAPRSSKRRPSRRGHSRTSRHRSCRPPAARSLLRQWGRGAEGLQRRIS